MISCLYCCGRLRQRVELAGMEARGHQEVARAFRRGRRQDRRGELGEAGLGHALAHLGDDLGALHDVPVQGLAAQVEEAVFQADVLRIVRLAEYRQRQFAGRREHFDLAGEHLDLAGRQVGIDGLGRARLDRAVDADHPFAAHGLGGPKQGESGSATICVRP